ncbi:MAG: hypothetical protein ABFD07_07260 [Methanobacterium sp.]
MEQYNITDNKFDKMYDLLSDETTPEIVEESIFGSLMGRNNVQPTTTPFNPENDIDAHPTTDASGNTVHSVTPEITQELRKIQEAFNSAEDGTARLMFLQWLLKSPEVRQNIHQLMSDAGGTFV